ncbi:hypothetical protein BGZ80_008410, partial [Entomortierella chlamydospora]
MHLSIIDKAGLHSKDGTSDHLVPQCRRDDLPPVWDPIWLKTESKLLKAVQQRDQWNAIVDNIPTQNRVIIQAIEQLTASHPPQVTLEGVQSALKIYYARYLSILRVSGDELDLETCFVNLAIVEAPSQREKDKQDLKEQAAVFHRIPSSEMVERANMHAPIPLEELFDKRKLRDGKENYPKTILVQGRA